VTRRLPVSAAPVAVVLFVLGALLSGLSIRWGINPHDEGLMLQADVSNAEQVEAAAATAVARWGAIDVWVNNAMVTVFSDVSQLQAEELRRVTEVTYHGAVWGTMAALRQMKRQGRGVIVQVGSALAYRSIPLQAAYCGAKSALRGFTDSLRSELIHERSPIHVTMVQLPAVNTPQFDVGRTHLPGRPRPPTDRDAPRQLRRRRDAGRDTAGTRR